MNVADNYTPGTIFMHPIQYNKLHSLMRVRHSSTADVDQQVTTWNGVPVKLDRSLPEGGWFIVPGLAS